MLDIQTNGVCEMPIITDWLMVAITAIYVIATIFICAANIRSANATKGQIAEMRRQFQEMNRPYITCEYVLGNRTFRGIRICNHGNMVAKSLIIRINDEFLDCINPARFLDFKNINSSKYAVIGIGQHFDFYFDDTTENITVPLIATITYDDDNGRSFSEQFTIDLSAQLPLMSVQSDVEKLTTAVMGITNELRRHQ